jgi:REP-associated tyrosine transposase
VCRKCADPGRVVRRASPGLTVAEVARPLRSDLPDGIYHVTTRGVAGTAIVRDDDDRRIFLTRLAEVVSRFDWCVHALCLMNTHYHLVIETTRISLSNGLKRLNGLYAQGFNERRQRSGHLFGDRFWASLIETESHFRAACWYVVCNPVRAGLCAAPEDWPWSRSRFGFEG